MLVVVQQRRRGYVYDAQQSQFVQKLNSPLQDAGSGYAMLQVRTAASGCV